MLVKGGPGRLCYVWLVSISVYMHDNRYQGPLAAWFTMSLRIITRVWTETGGETLPYVFRVMMGFILRLHNQIQKLYTNAICAYILLVLRGKIFVFWI